MNQGKILKIKELIKRECKELGFVSNWFYDEHLCRVEKNAKWLLKKIPEADKEVVLLGVWLHDTQRIRGIKIDHQKGGAQEAEKIMKQNGYDEGTIKSVQSVILTHSCNSKMPVSLEGKILASADAMAHYNSNFFLRIALQGDRTFSEYKKWALEKLDRNYNRKIFFDFAKEKIEKRHNIIKSFISNSDN